MTKQHSDDDHELTYLERKRLSQTGDSSTASSVRGAVRPQSHNQMPDTDDFYDDGDNEYEQRRKERNARTKRRRKRHLRLQVTLFLLLFLLIAALAGVILYLPGYLQKRGDPAEQTSANVTSAQADSITASQGSQASLVSDQSDDPKPNNSPEEADAAQQDIVDTVSTLETSALSPETEGTASDTSDVIAQADLMAAGYDYDGAIALLNGVSGSSDSTEIQAAISRYEAEKASCVAVDVTTVPHIFYHSLVNEPSYAFSVERLGQGAADGMNAWMTTVDEFDKITQQLYDNGYVYVRLRDLVNETVDDEGNVHFTPRTDLMLPEGKKAIVLSVDDLSYYHSYENASFPDSLVLDDNGKVKCHYILPDGTESIGDYDVVPRLNTFLEEHPDGAYKGARGLIALTGYNGVFGYRTDIDYEEKAHLMSDQAAWLDAHPDYNRDDEIAKATVIADAIKEEGWEFASHTWGHLSVTSKSADQIMEDNQKWVNNVQNIVGPTDTIIFAHGNDIGDWMPYSSDNEKFQALKNAGYNFYCNVDGSVPYWVQINDDCVRQGRINLDGYMLYQSSQGATTVIDNLFTASEVFDSRRPTPVVANGEG